VPADKHWQPELSVYAVHLEKAWSDLSDLKAWRQSLARPCQALGWKRNIRDSGSQSEGAPKDDKSWILKLLAFHPLFGHDKNTGGLQHHVQKDARVVSRSEGRLSIPTHQITGLSRPRISHSTCCYNTMWCPPVSQETRKNQCAGWSRARKGSAVCSADYVNCRSLLHI
jgi:hypothetical protein